MLIVVPSAEEPTWPWWVLHGTARLAVGIP